MMRTLPLMQVIPTNPEPLEERVQDSELIR